MAYIKRVINIFQKPFPSQEDVLGFFKVVFFISLFVTLFLYNFQPSEISSIESGRFWVCLGFGLTTFFASVFFEVLFNRIFKLRGKPEHFTFGKWILQAIGIMLTISLANFLYIRYAFFGYMNWEFFPHMIYGTFSVGIFPMVALGAINLFRQEKKYQTIAEEINKNEDLTPEEVLEHVPLLFDIPIDRIRYVEALQNYVKIGHLNDSDQLVEQTERTTLKRIEDIVAGSKLVKCHRSYLVNRSLIVSAEGNAQGLLLSLKDSNKTIPVSRSFVSSFR